MKEDRRAKYYKLVVYRRLLTLWAFAAQVWDSKTAACDHTDPQGISLSLT